MKITINQVLVTMMLLLGVASQFTNPGCATFASPGSTICRVCLDRYYLSGGICLPANPLCPEYSLTTGACISCYQSFVLVDNRCLPEIPHCQNYSSNGSCMQCVPAYSLNNSQCTPMMEGCLDYDSQLHQCNNCAQ